jgi:biotin carboxyl carrier protein
VVSEPADLEVAVGGEVVLPAEGLQLRWVDASAGIARLSDGHHSALVVVEGSGTDWTVVLRGRRVAVTVRSWRERTLADASSRSGAAGGPVEVKATLPGLVVAIETEEGSEVAEGARLLTIEAMKMQNEVRAPRAGRVTGIAVIAGDAVTTGQLLVRLE